MKPAFVRGDKAHQSFRFCLSTFQRVLAGFFASGSSSVGWIFVFVATLTKRASLPTTDLPKTVEEFFRQLYNPELPILEFQECLSRISMKLPRTVVDQISNELDRYRRAIGLQTGSHAAVSD
jgi:hypothetical protein